MRHLVLSLAIASVLLIGMFVLAQAQTSTNIDYTISIVQPESHTMHVRIDITGLQQSPLELTLHESVAANDIVSNFTATDDIGNPLPIEDCEFKGCCKWVTLNGAENITIEYDILQDFSDPSETRIGDTYAVIEASRTIYKTRVSEEDVASIELFLNLPAGWDVLTDFEQIGYHHYRLSSLDEIIDDDFGVTRTSVIVAGEMTRRDISFDGVQMRLAIFDQIFDDGFPITMDRFAEVSENLYRFYADYFGGMTSTSPTMVLTPGKAGHIYGINTLAQCYKGIVPGSTNEWQITYPWNFTHHMAHAWWINALSIEPDAEPRYHFMKEFINGYTNILSLEGAGLWEDYEQAWRWLLGPTISTPNNVPDMVKGDFDSYLGVFGTPDDLPLSGAEGYPKFKGVALAAVLDHRLALLTDGEQDLSDFFAHLFQQNGGYWFNPAYLVDADVLLEELNAFSGYDFTDFFDRYVYGLELIPYEPYYYYDKALVTVDEANFNKAKSYFTTAHQLAVERSEDDLAAECEQWIARLSEDSDGDGLSTPWEEYLGTDPQDPDTDEDGLNDRDEVGVIIDGMGGEYGLDQPLIEDPQGDSLSPEAGTDIKAVYAKTFLNENRDEELYLVLSTWDNQYNPDAWYEFRMNTSNDYPSDYYEYRFEESHSHLFHRENGDIANGRVEGWFEDWLEVKIPLELIESPSQLMWLEGLTRAGGDPSIGLDNVDWTSGAGFTPAPQIFTTDPLNPDTDSDGLLDGEEVNTYGTDPLARDTDGDGVSDGVEVQFGSDPTDPADVVWPVWLPIVLRSH